MSTQILLLTLLMLVCVSAGQQFCACPEGNDARCGQCGTFVSCCEDGCAIPDTAMSCAKFDPKWMKYIDNSTCSCLCRPKCMSPCDKCKKSCAIVSGLGSPAYKLCVKMCYPCNKPETHAAIVEEVEEVEEPSLCDKCKKSCAIVSGVDTPAYRTCVKMCYPCNVHPHPQPDPVDPADPVAPVRDPVLCDKCKKSCAIVNGVDTPAYRTCVKMCYPCNVHPHPQPQPQPDPVTPVSDPVLCDKCKKSCANINGVDTPAYRTCVKMCFHCNKPEALVVEEESIKVEDKPSLCDKCKKSCAIVSGVDTPAYRTCVKMCYPCNKPEALVAVEEVMEEPSLCDKCKKSCAIVSGVDTPAYRTCVKMCYPCNVHPHPQPQPQPALVSLVESTYNPRECGECRRDCAVKYGDSPSEYVHCVKNCEACQEPSPIPNPFDPVKCEECKQACIAKYGEESPGYLHCKNKCDSCKKPDTEPSYTPVDPVKCASCSHNCGIIHDKDTPPYWRCVENCCSSN